MQFSEKQLQKWVNIPVEINELANKLSLAGLEVAAIVPASGEFTQVVIGQILETVPHPNADKLKVCSVDIHQAAPLTIVCGAANAQTGLRVAVATVGARLPNGIKIKRAKLRGVASEGMLCAAAELGLAQTSEGIMALPDDAPIGAALSHYLDLPDPVFHIDLTPNRGDCLSVLGIAREVGALYGEPVALPALKPLQDTCEDRLPVTIIATQACARYCARVVRGIDVHAKTPMWLQTHLQRFGLRPIHPVVDVLNYTLFTLGQPMHAFDLKRITDQVCVRYAKAGESLTLLDEKTLTLNAQDLVIADADRVLALAGIMGGQDSGVSDDTTDILLESAYFDPTGLGLTARAHKLQTDASYRFERGVDPHITEYALDFATQLLQSIAGGKAGEVIVQSDAAHLPSNALIRVSKQQVEKQLGVKIDAKVMSQHLSALGFDIQADSSTHIDVRAPAWRFDVQCAADVIEEIARLYGYEQIPARLPIAPLQAYPVPVDVRQSIGQLLVDRGYHEVINYSFIDSNWQRQVLPQYEALLTLLNPISSDMDTMRVSLWPGLLNTLQYNQHHQQKRVRLFEIGACFYQADDAWQQVDKVAGVIVGQAYPERWCHPSTQSSFYDLKGDIEALDALIHVCAQLRYERSSHPALHPGQCADIYSGEVLLGCMGALHPSLVKQLKCDGQPFLFELDLSVLENNPPIVFKKVSKMPMIRRDIAFLVDNTVSFEQIRSKVLESGIDLLKNIELFDEYVGQGVPAGQRSLAMSLTLQDPARTLIDEQINTCIDTIVASLVKAFNVSLRK